MIYKMKIFMLVLRLILETEKITIKAIVKMKIKKIIIYPFINISVLMEDGMSGR